MCCLRYEHEFYVQSRKRFPKEGKVLVTSLGEEKVVANDIFGDRVTLRGLDGETRVVALVELKREIEAAGEAAEAAARDEPDESPNVVDALDEGIILDTVERPIPTLEELRAPAPPRQAPSPAPESAERRPHRRRGRRGGRRNRPGGDTPRGTDGKANGDGA